MRLNTRLSSIDRARVTKLLASIVQLLSADTVALALAVFNKGEIVIEVRDGKALEVRPTPHLRIGYEIPRRGQHTGTEDGTVLKEWMKHGQED